MVRLSQETSSSVEKREKSEKRIGLRQKTGVSRLFCA
jgi:hypothetical protein